MAKTNPKKSEPETKDEAYQRKMKYIQKHLTEEEIIRILLENIPQKVS